MENEKQTHSLDQHELAAIAHFQELIQNRQENLKYQQQILKELQDNLNGIIKLKAIKAGLGVNDNFSWRIVPGEEGAPALELTTLPKDNATPAA